MSRVGRAPIPVPAGVEVSISGQHVTVKGSKGTLDRDLPGEITIRQEGAELIVERPNDERQNRALHGLVRSLVNNMVVGVTAGFQKTLLLEGTGYRASMQGAHLNLAVGYSHPVSIAPPDGITFSVEGTQTIRIAGISKQAVGQAAADVRKVRKVEPYKGKGLRYEGEYVNRKESKKGA